MGMHQPVGGLYRSIARTDPKSSSLRRQSLIASLDTTNNRHSRVHSETNIPSDSSFANDNKRVSRSVSAMGASTSSSLHTDNRSFQYAPTRAYLTHRSSVSSTQSPIHMNDQGQQDQAAQSPVSTEDSSPDSPHGLGISSEEGSKSSPDGFSPVYSSFGPPSRAQSQLQVRDLQYQMKGLHIKISSLKVKTQEDNLRRRSLQSLRTPSPLTAADHWYANALELRDGQSSRGSNPRRDVSSENTRDVSHDAAADDRRRYDEHAAKNTPKHAGNRQGYEPADYADDQSVAETMYEDAEEGDFDEDIDREALDEILREPLDDDFENDMEAFPDVPSHTDATPHEMREDAFDYEHFILHSALGNYTQQLRRVSNSSNGSVETTRPTYARHSRTNSNMSVSTVATFATANEGERPDDEDDVDSVMYWDRRFNHGAFLRSRFPLTFPTLILEQSCDMAIAIAIPSRIPSLMAIATNQVQSKRLTSRVTALKHPVDHDTTTATTPQWTQTTFPLRNLLAAHPQPRPVLQLQPLLSHPSSQPCARHPSPPVSVVSTMMTLRCWKHYLPVLVTFVWTCRQSRPLRIQT